jgi:hypothetical protein
MFPNALRWMMTNLHEYMAHEVEDLVLKCLNIFLCYTAKVGNGLHAIVVGRVAELRVHGAFRSILSICLRLWSRNSVRPALVGGWVDCQPRNLRGNTSDKYSHKQNDEILSFSYTVLCKFVTSACLMEGRWCRDGRLRASTPYCART